MIVLDASAVLAWALGDENELAAELPNQLSSAISIVPSHWILEVGNGLQMALRRGRLQAGEPSAVLERIRQLPIRLDAETTVRAWQETPVLAARHGLTTYDAAYLELALRLDLPLATLDKNLRRAARAAGAALFE